MTQLTLKEEFDDLLLELRHQKDLPPAVIEHLRAYPAYLEDQIGERVKKAKKNNTAKLKKLQKKNEEMQRKVSESSSTKGLLSDLHTDLGRKKDKIEELTLLVSDQYKRLNILRNALDRKPKVIRDKSNSNKLREQENYIVAQDDIIKDQREKIELMKERNLELHHSFSKVKKLVIIKEDFREHINQEIQSLGSVYKSHKVRAENSIRDLQGTIKKLEGETATLKDKLKYTLIYNLKKAWEYFWNHGRERYPSLE